MFPNGVIFEGVSEDPQYYRGETGAQDSIIPSCDNFLQLSRRYPNNELTEYLVDLRFYRPQDHRKYLEWVESASDAADVAATAMRSSRPALALLQNLHQVQTVRSMHWSMTKKYIIERTPPPPQKKKTSLNSLASQQRQRRCVTLGYLCERYVSICKGANIHEIIRK